MCELEDYPAPGPPSVQASPRDAPTGNPDSILHASLREAGCRNGLLILGTRSRQELRSNLRFPGPGKKVKTLMLLGPPRFLHPPV